MRRRFHIALQLVKLLGPSWVAFRIGYAMRLRTGLLCRQMPAYPWSRRPFRTWLKPDIPYEPHEYFHWRGQQGIRFFFDQLPQAFNVDPSVQGSVLTKANRVLEGSWPYFSHDWYTIGFPPDWHFNPQTQHHLLATRHWTQIGDFEDGDIKLVWEPNRFAVVFLFARAYVMSRDERYADAFWRLVEDWAECNPPQLGPNWKCGQEVSIRLMAWIFGLYVFLESVHTTPERVATLVTLIAAQTERIERNISYAHSGKSNHGISEAAGLWTVGLLFPELAKAQRWRDKGRQLLEEEIKRQIYVDGSYVMPSLNYYRMALHACLWSLRLGELNGQLFGEDVYSAVSKGIRFLSALTDPFTGQTPNFGSNDGAMILPLNHCDYVDFRPLLQLGQYACHRNLLFDAGPWDEDVFWLYGKNALCAQRIGHTPNSQAFQEGGYYTLRSSDSWAMIRCAALRDRPFQLDQLHVDLWWKGINIACDAGTFLYNGPPPWNNGLASTAVHNTVMVDRQEQSTQVGRFTWVDWAQGRRRHLVRSGSLQYWEGEHDGYRRLPDPVVHRRAVLQIGAEHWLIVDRLSGSTPHEYRLHWLIADFPYSWSEQDGRLSLTTPSGSFEIIIASFQMDMDVSLVRADPHSTRGWRSLYYNHRVPALSVTGTVKCDDVVFLTFLGPAGNLVLLDNSIQLKADRWTAEVVINRDDFIRSISVTGSWMETLHL